jgi:TRAP-type C4-dicarboxylate transport system, periplasmic component
MRRRTFLAGLGFAALQLAGCGTKPQTTPDYVLTYADNQPAGYPTTQGAQYFASLVQQQTGGKVVIQVKANGEYGSEQQVWEQLAIGGVDFARVSLSVATDDLPRLNVLLLPYLYRNADHMWRVLDGSIRSRVYAGLYRAWAGGPEAGTTRVPARIMPVSRCAA